MSKASLAMDLAQSFIERNLRVCCVEAVEFRASGILGSGKIREAAVFYNEVNPRQSLKMALDEVARQAIAQVAK